MEQINYKQKYEESFKKAKDLHDNHALGMPFIYETCEQIFPELKESEDERMKDIITKALCTNAAQEEIEKYGINAIDCVDWLEKQGEQTPIDAETTELNALAFLTELGYTCIPPIKQNPAWSEEDEKTINDIMWIIEAYRKNGFNETHIQIADSSENWLKSLKERIIEKH